MDGEFRTYCVGVIDLLEREEDLETKQSVLDKNDDRITGLLDHLYHLALLAGGEDSTDLTQSGVSEGGCCTWKGTSGNSLMQSLLLKTYQNWIDAYWSNTTNSEMASSLSCMTSHRASCQWMAISPSCQIMKPWLPRRFLTASKEIFDICLKLYVYFLWKDSNDKLSASRTLGCLSFIYHLTWMLNEVNMSRAPPLTHAHQ